MRNLRQGLEDSLVTSEVGDTRVGSRDLAVEEAGGRKG